MSDQRELRATESLLDRGIKFQISAPWWLRLFGKKTVRVIVRQPRLGVLYRISNLFLKMDVDVETLATMDMKEGFAALNSKVKIMCEIAAVSMLGYYTGKWFRKPVARYLFCNCRPDELYALFYAVIMFSGVKDFLNTIRLISVLRMTEPKNLSPDEKGS